MTQYSRRPNDRYQTRRQGGPQNGRQAPRQSRQYRSDPYQSAGRGRRSRQPMPAHSSRPQRRRRSAWPIVVAVLFVAVVGVGAFFVLRSCGNNAASTVDGQAAGEQAAQVGQGNTNATATEDGTTQASTTGKNKDGSVDIDLLMVGDMLFHYQVRMSGLKADGTRNYDHLFTHFVDELDGKDIKVLNQETPIAGNIYTGSAPDGYDGYPEFNGPQEVGDAEAKAGFNVILKATNHAMDNASNFSDPYTLVRSEQTFWKTKHPEVAVIGEVDPDDDEASVDDVYVFEKDGFKVALLNYTQDLNGNEGFDTQGVVSMLEEEHVKKTMAKARELADMIVVFPHWGEEYTTEPVDMQYEWAQVFIDEGADVIIGNHPHVIEPVTALEGEDGNKVPCFWSTGNYISTSPEDGNEEVHPLVGGAAEVTLHKDADGTCSVTAASFKPLVSHQGESTDMTTYLAKDYTDDLAATNGIDTEINPGKDDSELTPAVVHEFCASVLGSGYDKTTGVYELKL